MHPLERLYVEIPAVRPGSVGAYSLAIGIAACATALRLAVDPFVAGVQYITFFPAVIITTFVSGIRAGFLERGTMRCRGVDLYSAAVRTN